ncbi:MAG TPA: chemotaxis protein CheW [Candidatus Omnitrophota bacterium]|nr:chemotaxis protein CheW [Candidatus Omnitrophota bacterium]HRZ14130.1 chemotaxis protein CheW [Candidatus Omnitrophota bacterium]
MPSNEKSNTMVQALAKEGKYLTFALGHEEYGLEILGVREIIGLMEITAVPQVPDYVKGVINLRGKVIPVIDLRLKFGMPKHDYTNETCIIVLNVNNSLMGIAVDRVCEVLDISQDNIEPAPSFGNKVHTDFITGMGKIGDKVKILLDIDKVLTEDVSLAAELLA